MAKYMDAMHMAQQGSYRGEPQRANNFEVVIVGLPSTLTAATESFPLPKISTPPVEIFKGYKVKFAGEPEFEDLSLVLKDFIEEDVESIVHEWQSQVYDVRSMSMGYASIYKKTGWVYEYAPDGTHIRSWVLDGCWPSNVDYGDMDYNNSDKKTINVTLSVDRAFRA